MHPAPPHVTAAISRGWHVFPLPHGQKAPGRWMTNWETRASTDPSTVTTWWARTPRNLAIATGPSRLVVVDLDVRKPGRRPPVDRPEWAHVDSGLTVLRALADEHAGPLPPTYTVRTASGGWHLYYQAPDGPELRNTCQRIGWLIDTRAHGGYVVAAGSLLNDRPYTVVRQVPELPVLPDWLAALSAPPAPAPISTLPPSGDRKSGYVGAALAGEVDRARNAPAGARNHALNKAAWNLAKFIATGQLDRSTVERDLQAAGEARLRDPHDTPRDVARTIRSAIDSGLRHHGIAS